MLYAIVAAGVAEVVSLPVIGANVLFPYGLALGVCASVISLHVISASIERAVGRGKKGPVIFGLAGRVVLYAGALVLAARTADSAFAGAAIGVLLPYLSLYVRLGLLPAIRRGVKKEPLAVYVADTSSNLFVKEPWLVRSARGKTYMTYRHYRKKRVM